MMDLFYQGEQMLTEETPFDQDKWGGIIAQLGSSEVGQLQGNHLDALQVKQKKQEGYVEE